MWVSIPAGQFTAGCESQSDCPKHAASPHPVSVQAFGLMQTEVPVESYSRCVSAGACTAPESSERVCNWGKEDRKNHPVNCVDQAQAKAFCAWAGGRLPTGDEWEYAAKSGQHNSFPWGNAAPDDSRAQYDRSGTAPVGSHPAGVSPWGLQDMAGNVNEWTGDELKEGVAEMRGGSFGFAEPRRIRADSRGGGPVTLKAGNVGFRCAREARQ